ncbi:MAG: HD-GYP domain-containing protein [Thermodesulfobacteriota bacterium]
MNKNIEKEIKLIKRQSIAYARDLARLYQREIEESKTLKEKLSELERVQNQSIIYARELVSSLKEIEETYEATLIALVSAIDAREHEVQAHSQRVREYTLTLAKRMGINGDKLKDISRGALLHDIGKIGISDNILLKPARLTEDEWTEMRKHPYMGYKILEGIKFLEEAAEIVYTHQERYDGQGYPRGLKGEDIPLGARLFVVSDTLDAMTSDRPYRKGLSFETAREEIIRCSGTQFDPKVVEIFLSISKEEWLNIRDRINAKCGGRKF